MKLPASIVGFFSCLIIAACVNKRAEQINEPCEKEAISDYFSYRSDLLNSGETAAHWNIPYIEKTFRLGNKSAVEKKIGLVAYIQRGDIDQKQLGSVVGIRIRCGIADTGYKYSQVAVKYILPNDTNKVGYALTYFIDGKITATGLIKETNTVDGVMAKDLQYELFNADETVDSAERLSNKKPQNANRRLQ